MHFLVVVTLPYLFLPYLFATRPGLLALNESHSVPGRFLDRELYDKPLWGLLRLKGTYAPLKKKKKKISQVPTTNPAGGRWTDRNCNPNEPRGRRYKYSCEPRCRQKGKVEEAKVGYVRIYTHVTGEGETRRKGWIYSTVRSCMKGESRRPRGGRGGRSEDARGATGPGVW